MHNTLERNVPRNLNCFLLLRTVLLAMACDATNICCSALPALYMIWNKIETDKFHPTRLQVMDHGSRIRMASKSTCETHPCGLGETGMEVLGVRRTI